MSAAVAACTDDPRAGTLPSASPVTPTTPSPTTPTASATDDLRGSLQQALRTYFDALYAAGMDPANKTDALAALIHESCTCRRVVEVLRQEARESRHIDYRYTLRDVQVVDVGATGGDIKYTVVRSAGAERDRSGRAIETYPATIEKYTAHFTRRDGRWLLQHVTRFT